MEGVALEGREGKPIEVKSRMERGLRSRRRAIFLRQKWAEEERAVKSKNDGNKKGER